MPVLAHPSLVVDLRGVAGAGRAVEPHAGAHQLRGVLVGRREIHVEARGGALHGERAHHVVGLEALDAHDRYAQRLGQLEGVGDGRGEVLRHLLPLRLVGGVRLVPERRAGRVHRQDGVGRALLAQDGLQAVRQPEERRGVYAARSHARVAEKHEMPPVEEGHHVDYE